MRVFPLRSSVLVFRFSVFALLFVASRQPLASDPRKMSVGKHGALLVTRILAGIDYGSFRLGQGDFDFTTHLWHRARTFATIDDSQGLNHGVTSVLVLYANVGHLVHVLLKIHVHIYTFRLKAYSECAKRLPANAVSPPINTCQAKHTKPNTVQPSQARLSTANPTTTCLCI